jgi:heavy metal translocating P-type ATPase
VTPELARPLEAASAVLNGSAVLRQPRRALPALLLAVAAGSLAGGGMLQWLAIASWSSRALAAGSITVLCALMVEVAVSLRRREFGLDIIAALSMGAALWFGEYLAAAIVATMYAGGQFLESHAQARAESGMTELLSCAPRLAVRIAETGLSEIPIAAIASGDRLLVRSGDIVPADGYVDLGRAVLNEAAITGESLPVRRGLREMIMSGVSNVGDAFEMVATRPATESTYAGIVRLVAEARRSKAPMSRLADRYSLAFLAMTVTIAAAAVYFSGDPVRLVAVLVVATPCPLILAVPVALVAGLSKAARDGVLIKGAHVLETLAGINVVVFDKTGTLTIGEPAVARIETDGNPNEVLRLAASLDQASAHSVGRTIVEEAKRRGLRLLKPADVHEVPGDGIEGRVDGHPVVVGGWDFVAKRCGLADPAAVDGERRAAAHVAVDGALVGRIVLDDPVRDDAARAIAGLRHFGVTRLTLATGDRIEVGAAIGDLLGLDAVKAGLTPAEKVETVRAEARHGRVMMIGDGVNDAPALASATVGVAVGRRNLAAAAEAADMVLLRDDLSRIGASLRIARQSRRIALQSVFSGIGLSVLAMIAAAFGYLTPVQGAILQEAIDVAVIFNALRAL